MAMIMLIIEIMIMGMIVNNSKGKDNDNKYLSIMEDCF